MLIKAMRRNQVTDRVNPERGEAIQHAEGPTTVSPKLYIQIGIGNRIRVVSLQVSRFDGF